jgi:hypothetical protein
MSESGPEGSPLEAGLQARRSLFERLWRSRVMAVVCAHHQTTTSIRLAACRLDLHPGPMWQASSMSSEDGLATRVQG